MGREVVIAKHMSTTEAPRERPRSGLGHYLRDLVYGSTDGVVTTIAVVAGVTGAQFAPRVGLVLGLANLAADGLSMGASNYLALKSELEQTGQDVAEEKPWLHGVATVAAFVCAGAVPLAAYWFSEDIGIPRFTLSLVVAILTLVGVGIARARLAQRSVVHSVFEIVSVAGGAGAVAYLLGKLVEPLT
jgi:VIT1/CCC1 family predicted Fe2+/Mn2+ transporter